MGLIDKIKRESKKLAMAGIASLVGCAGVEPGPLHPSRLLFDGTVFNRDNQQQEVKPRLNIKVPSEVQPSFQTENFESAPYLSYSKPYSTSIGNGGIKYVPSRHLLTGSCNYIKDLDGDNRFRYPHEFANIKRIFGKEDKIEVYFGGSFQYDEIKYELLNSKGEVIKRNFMNKPKGEWFGPFIGWNKLLGSFYETYDLISAVYNETKDSATDKLKPGNYRAVWYTDGNLATTWDFQVVE